MSAATPPPELHLPDLPDVSVLLGGASPPPPADQPPRPQLPWHTRWQQTVSAYLPLLLMGLLAAGTWWLVKHTPQPPAPGPKKAERQTPDYTMSGFSVTRFGPDGRVVLRIDGAQLRHYPATDRMEVDEVRIHAVQPDGRVTDAQAQRALVNGDATEVQLIGGAQVVSRSPQAEPVEIRSEFLHGFVRFERVRTHLPVTVVQGSRSFRAGGLDYEHLPGRLSLAGPVRLVVPPGPGPAKP